MRKQILSLAVALLIGSTVCMAQNCQNGKAGRENCKSLGRQAQSECMEQIVANLGLNEKQAKDFKAAMEEMKPARNKSNERPTREEMQKKRQETDAKIKSILTDEQYKKYQDMCMKDNAKKKGTVCMAQNCRNVKAGRENCKSLGRQAQSECMERIVANLGLNEKQAKDFKAAMEEMRPARNKLNERSTWEEMQKKRQETDAKIKSILTDEQYKKYQDMRMKDNAKKKKKAK